MGIGLFISIVVIIVVIVAFYRSRQKDPNKYIVPANLQQLLSENVSFYTKLDANSKTLFKTRVKDFLTNVAVRGVDVAVDDLDRTLVAAGAIIPIFAFPDWRYNNLSEVLLYKDTFNKQFLTKGDERNVLGMVGDGPLHREMLLSKPSLRTSFQNPGDGSNTAIHEFTHLIDKADGAVDGVPEYLLANPYIIPWIKGMHQTIIDMKTGDATDINTYGATNDAEFLAVITEYFFERPTELKANHPDLYLMLEQMFHKGS